MCILFGKYTSSPIRISRERAKSGLFVSDGWPASDLCQFISLPVDADGMRSRAGTPPYRAVFPVLEADDECFSERPAARFKLLHALRLASDKCSNEVLCHSREMLTSFSEELGKMLPGTTDLAYDDPELLGGGVTRLDALLHRRLRYCSNTEQKNGKYTCGRLIPDNHKGHICPHEGCECEISRYVHHVIELKHLYPLLMEQADLLQRIADYYPISIARLSQGTSNVNAKVWCVESGFIARRDYERNPANFTLDILPKLGEKAFFDTGSSLELCKVIEAKGIECDKGMYKIELLADGSIITVSDQHRSIVQKIGGTIPINVVRMDDGAELYKSMQYSNDGTSEEVQNIAEHHRRRYDLCCFMGTTSGGMSHPNVRENNVWFEKQRRHLSQVGATCKKASCMYAGRKVTVHHVNIRRNEYHRTLDHPEMVKQAGTMGLRNCHSMNPFIRGFEALNSGHHALYSYLMNKSLPSLSDKAIPIIEEQADDLFRDAEELLGKPGWQEHAQKTGVKHKAVAEAGAAHHNLTPDSTQNAWSRIDMGSMHFLGIVDNTFRQFVISQASPAARRCLSVSPFVLRQPPGTKRLHNYVQVDNRNNAKFTSAGEKLHQKLKWRKTLMLYDLKPLFEGDSEKTRDMHQVAMA